MSAIKPQAAAGFVLARLRIQYGRHSITESHHYGAGSPRSFLNLLSWHCFLRSTWLGQGASITFASVSDMGSGRDGGAASGLPYTNPYALQAGPIGNFGLGYEYRFDMDLAHASNPGQHAEYMLFRGIPSQYVAGEALATGPDWGSVPAVAGVTAATLQGALSALLGTKAPTNASLPGGIPTLPGLAASGLGPAFAMLFIPFLLAKTYKLYFVPGGPVLPPPQVTAGTWNALPFKAANFRRLGERRAGGIFGQPKGRFSS